MPEQSGFVYFGAPIPGIALLDEHGAHQDLRAFASGPTLVAFVANHCPYVRHIEVQLGALASDFAGMGLRVVGVASNDVATHPDDDFGGMRGQAERAGWEFPYLRDPDQTLAREIGAVCTPDFFLFDADGRLAYRGAFDGSTPKNGIEASGDDMRAAVTAVLDGRAPPSNPRPVLGCGIKWLDHR